MKTWDILEEIDQSLKKNSIFQKLEINLNLANDELGNNLNNKIEIFGGGTIDHPLSGYNDIFNEAIIKSLSGIIEKDGTITTTIKFKMVVGPVNYIDRIREFKNVYSQAKVGKLETLTYTAKNAEDFVEWLEEIPQ